MGRLLMPFLFVLLDVICMSFTEGLFLKLELEVGPNEQSLICNNTSKIDQRLAYDDKPNEIDSGTYGREILRIPESGTKLPINLCDHPIIDAAVSTYDGRNYLFLGEYYVQYGCNDVLPGYPRRISDDWEGISGPIDAGFGWHENKVYLFKGDSYWRFTGTQKDAGYPRKISDGFPGIPDYLGAVFIWHKNQKPYFFKGYQYWRFDSDKTPPIERDYPRAIGTYWEGLPENVDAAVRWDNNITYFFKESHYYRFDTAKDKVDGDARNIDEFWFNCR